MLGSSESAPEIVWRDRVIANKWLYRFTNPRRGDIVVYRTTDAEGQPTIWTQRVVGLPGETVDIESPYVLIDGKQLTEPAIFAKIAARQDGFSGYLSVQEMYERHDISLEPDDVTLPLRLGPEEYFLLGDNSPLSVDSRFRGTVRREDIVGRVFHIYWPPSRIRVLE